MGLMELPPVEPGRLIVTPHPMLLDGQRNVVWEARAGESLYAILQRNVPEMDGQRWEVCIGGRAVERHLWHHVFPKHGQVIEVRGGLGRSALAVVAMVALTYFTFGIGTAAGWGAGAAAGAFGGGLAGAAFATGVFMAGAMLVNKVLGPKQARARSSDQDSIHSISSARNQLRPYEPFPLLFGRRVRITPDLLSKPYTWYEGNDQYLGILLSAGINVGRIEELYNGDTPLSNYEGVQVTHAGYTEMPDQTIPLFSNVDTIDGAELPNDATWVQRTTSDDTVRIQINLEYILGGQGTSGKNYYVNETVEAQYRVTGATNWMPLASQTFRSEKFDVRRATLARDVERGQYDVRVRILGQGNYNGKNTQKNDFQWTQLSSVQADDADYTGIARTGVRIKATGQLNGSPDELRGEAFAKPIPEWNGTAWVTKESSNPGAQCVAYARGIREGGRLLGGMALSDEQIDLSSWKAFTLHCAANGYTYDYYIKDARSHTEVLSSIARAGFGEITWAGGRLGVVWAAQEQPLSGVVNMATIKKGQFQVDYSLVNAADGIEYTYLDGETWETRTLRVPAPGVETMLNPAQVQGEGVTTEQHAARMARWHLAQSLYQYKDISYSTDIEHLSYQRMSLLALQHDMTQWGYGGRVRAAVNAAGTVTLTLDEPVPAPATGNAFIGVRIPGERVYRVLKVRPFSGESRTVELAEPWPDDAAVPGDTASNPAHDTLWIYDFKQTPGYRVRVTSIEPESDLKGAAIRCVPEGPEFWEYVLNGRYIPAPNQSLLQTRPVASNLRISEQQVVQGNTTFTELTATFDVTGPVGTTVVRAAGADGELQDVAQTVTRTATWRINEPGQYTIVVRPYSPDGEAGVAVQAVYTTAGAGLPPVLVDLFGVEERSGGVRLYTWGWLEDTMQSPDFAGVEIRYIAGNVPAPDWDEMTPLGESGYYTAPFESVLPEAGEWTIACRSRNSGGDLSTGMRIVTRTLSENLGQQIDDIGGSIDDLTQQQVEQQQQIEQDRHDSVQRDLANATAIADEAADRAAAIAAEAADRAAAIAAEASARTSAILAEATARTNAINDAAATAADDLLNAQIALEASISNEANLRQSADSSLANQIATISAGTGEQFDTGGGIWYFDTAVDGWSGSVAPSAVDGWLRTGVGTGATPYLQSPVLAVDSTTYRYVKTRIRKTAGIGTWRGVLQWITASDAAWNTAKQVAVEEPTWDANNIATLDLRDIPWAAGVTRIRLSLFAGPITASVYWEHDWIAIGRPSPGASAAALQDEREARISGDAAQATARETLAAQLRGSYTGTDVAALTSGLVYNERQARVSGDAAIASDVSSLQARMPAGSGTLATEASVTAEATARANADSALGSQISSVSASLGGKGANLLPAQYSRLTGPLPPLSYTTQANVTAREVVENADAVNGFEYHFIDTGASNSNRIYFSPSSTDYNLPLGKSGKFIVSFWARSSVAGARVRAATGFSGTNGYSQGSIVTLTTERTRYTSIINIGSVYDACNLLLMPALDGVPVEIWTDGWMIEESVNGNETPSAFVAGSDYSEAINARVTQVESASVTRDNALSQRTSVVEGRMPTGSGQLATDARVTQVESASVTRDNALSDRVGIVEAKAPADGGRAASEARVVQAEQAAASANSATAQRVSDTEARLPAGTGKLATEAQATAAMQHSQDVNARVTQVESASVTRDNALSQRTSVVEGRMPTGSGQLATDARVTQVESASVTRDNALSDRVGIVEAKAPADGGRAASEARVVQAEQAAASANSATAQQVTHVMASLDGMIGVDDPSFETGFGWSTSHNNPDAGLSGGMYYSTSNVRTGLRMLAVTANTGIMAAYSRGSIPCSEGEVFRIGAASRGLVNPAGAAWQVWVVGYARAEDVTSATDKRLGYLNVVERVASGSSWAWEDMTGTITIPAGWGCFRIMCRVNGALTTGYLAWEDVHVDRVDTQLAAVTQAVRADVDAVTGKFNASVTTVLDVNGYQIGTRTENDGVRGGMDFLMDYFRIHSAAGAIQGMEWLDGYLRVYGSGWQRLIGYNFGVPGDRLVDWFGPNIGPEAASRANGLQWSAVNESGLPIAYFGGDILQGVNRQFNSNDTVSTTASVSTGPVSRKNKATSVTGRFQYQYIQSYPNFASQITLAGGATSATIVLERRYGSGNWTELSRVTLSGSDYVLNETDGPSSITQSISGQIFATDAASTASTEYRTRVINISRRQYTVTNPGNVPAPEQTQYQSIESLE